MRQIKTTFSDEEENKAVIRIRSQQGKVIALRPFVWEDGDSQAIGIAIEYEEI